MKNFKSLISIILTAVMLITAVPSAFASDVTVEVQSENYSFSQYKPAFSSSLPSGISTGYADNYRTKTAIAPVVRDGSDYGMKITASTHTGTSGTNYGDVRFSVNPKAVVKNQKYTISYDICFSAYDAPASDRGIMKMSAVTQGNSWNINRGLFTISATHPDRIYAQGTGAYITKGDWYSITHNFDVASGVETMLIADSAGNTQTVTTTANNVTEITRFNFAFLVPCEVLIDNLDISSGSVLIAGLDSSVSANEDIVFKAVAPDGFDTAKLTADGAEIASFACTSGKNCYLVTIPAGSFSIGSHTIGLTVHYGATPVSVESTVNVAQSADRGISRSDGTETSTEVTTFDELKYSTGAAMNDEVGLTEIKWNAAEAATPWQTNANAFMVPGPSGDDGDYGLQIRSSSNLIQIFKLDTENTLSTGKLVMDFDMLCTSDGTNVKMSKQMGRPDSSNSFLAENKLFGSIDIEAGEWTHVNMVFDFDTSMWTVRANGQEVAYDATSQNKSFSEIRFTLYSARTPFAIDNVRIYNTRYYSGVKKMEYIAGSAATEITTKVPADADAVKLITGEGIDASTIDCITVSDTSGKAVELASVTYSASDKSITITPKTKFPEARGIVVVFGEGAKFADGTLVAQPYSVSFDVESSSIITSASFKVNGSSLTEGSQLGSGDVVSVDISAENISVGESTCTYILSLRKLSTVGGEQISQLVSLKAKDVSLAASGTLDFTLTLDAITVPGDYEVYLMIIDSFANSKSKAEYIKIN